MNRQPDPDVMPTISCRSARMERNHKPHIYQERLHDNGPMSTTTWCPGYPAVREDGHDDKKGKAFKDAVKGIADKAGWDRIDHA